MSENVYNGRREGKCEEDDIKNKRNSGDLGRKKMTGERAREANIQMPPRDLGRVRGSAAWRHLSESAAALPAASGQLVSRQQEMFSVRRMVG